MPSHREKRVLVYSPRQMFDLVADVDRYPEFLPWCLATRVMQKEKDDPTFHAEMVIGFKMVRERFTSHVTLHPNAERIDVSYTDGPFKYLKNHWIFEPHPNGCQNDFYVDFEFRSRFLENMMSLVFTEAVRRMVRAFEERARDLYGVS